MRIILLLIGSCFLFGQCKVNKNKTAKNDTANYLFDEIKVSGKKNNQDYPYQPSAKKVNNLVHTWLDLKFSYEKQQVSGKAVITLKPHFYATDSLHLEAKKFILNRVAIVHEQDTTALKYTYNEQIISIALGKTYKADEEYTIFIDYVARPNEIEAQGSRAISDAKGLYFINPLKQDKDKPRQIWTQGETQSNSGWFPTIDAPNQKMTQDILLTVDKNDVTLSNGELILSKENEDGTRTDHWKQTLPHAPYLAMITVGEFAIVKDFWRDSLEVDYYVESAYEPYAKLIFGNTPEMIECFSKLLGVDYPWQKYAQVVVRDFVSGAMENTSAVIHFDALQHDSREHLDNPYEDIIAHELFHHWFGDLVTCESWSNIPLNESFATYGQYLWQEYKYGRMTADYNFDDNLHAYLMNGRNYEKTPVRFHYKTHEDMFDAVSYQKGSRILHMLRYYVGDEAFFKSLQLYLTRHQFSTVEIHNLRLTFEEITGEDLNWFFNQWFLSPGHPLLQYDYTRSEDGKKVKVTITQNQDTGLFGIYHLPIHVDIYSAGKAKRTPIEITKHKQTFEFTADTKIDLINIDAEKVLLAEITDNNFKDALVYQFLNAPLYIDKWYALHNYISDTAENKADNNLIQMTDYALNHIFHGLRSLGLEIISELNKTQQQSYENVLVKIASDDSVSSNRRQAIELLTELNAGKHQKLFEQKLNDSSYMVCSAVLSALYKTNPQTAIQYAAQYEESKSGALLSSVASLYSQSGDAAHIPFFINAMQKSGNYKYNILSSFWGFIEAAQPNVQAAAIDSLQLFVTEQKADKYIQYINLQLSTRLQQTITEDIAQMQKLLKKEKDPVKKSTIEKQIANADLIVEKLQVFVK